MNQNIQVQVRMFSGEICQIDMTELSIQTIQTKLYDHYVGKNGRNEMVRVFYEEQELLSDDDLRSVYTNDEKKDDEQEKILFAFIHHEKKMKLEETKEVEKTLVNHLKQTFEHFQESVVNAKALVAGGSILATFGNYSINDLDIYVHYSNAKQLITNLCQKCNYYIPNYGGFHQATQYDQSFFRKNNILSRFCLSDRTRHHRKTIDVMIIPDDYPLENVVTNFDLSFCEVWWDGKDVYANDPYGVRSKSGILKPDYRKSLFQEMNMFIINRMQKYQSRGFKIDIGMIEFAKTLEQEIVLEKPAKKSKINPSLSEAWAISKFLNELYKEIHIMIRDTRSILRSTTIVSNIIFSLFPQQNTYEHLLEKIPKEMITSFAHFFMKEGAPCFFRTPYKEFYLQTFPESNDDRKPLNVDERIVILSTFLRSFVENEEEMDAMIKSYKQSYRNLDIYNQNRLIVNHPFVIRDYQDVRDIQEDLNNYQFDDEEIPE